MKLLSLCDTGRGEFTSSGSTDSATVPYPARRTNRGSYPYVKQFIDDENRYMNVSTATFVKTSV